MATQNLGWLLLLFFSVFVATGPTFLARMPLTIFRYPARLVPFAALALVALAVAGWDRLRRDRQWLDLLLVAILVVDLHPRVRPLLRSEPFRRHPVSYDASIGAMSKIIRHGDVEPLRRDAWIAGYLNLYDRRFDSFTPAPMIFARYERYYRDLMSSPSHTKFVSGAMGFTISREVLPTRYFRRLARSGDIFVYGHAYPTPMAAHLSRNPLTMRPSRWSMDTSHARVTVNAVRDGVLALRQQAAPGWRVTVDGKPAESLVIDGVHRAVNVGKGHHEVVWTYRPTSLLVGAAMTLVTLLSLAISVFVKRTKP